MRRDITKVMDQLRPALTAGGVDLRGLDSMQQAVGFTAPEEMRMRWEELCLWLETVCPDPKHPDAPQWVREVSDIIEGRK